MFPATQPQQPFEDFVQQIRQPIARQRDALPRLGQQFLQRNREAMIR
jgi:hypothetical protein